MPHVQVQATTRASAIDIWKMWIDVEASPTWDTDVEMEPAGRCVPARHPRRIQAQGRPELRFKLDRVELLRSYSNSVRLPGLRVRFTHEFESIDDRRSVVRHGAVLSGPLAWVLAPFLVRKLRTALLLALQNMLMLAEQKANLAAAA